MVGVGGGGHFTGKPLVRECDAIYDACTYIAIHLLNNAFRRFIDVYQRGMFHCL